MSAVNRQRTCAACGKPFHPGELTDLEPLIDGMVRYVAVHAGHSTHPAHTHPAHTVAVLEPVHQTIAA